MSQEYTGSFTQMLLGLLPESTEQSKSIVKPILKVLSLFWFVFFK